MPTTEHEERLHDGMHYPIDHLVAALKDEQEAWQAARDLNDAGFEDVVVLVGPQAVEAIETEERKENSLARMGAAVHSDVRRG